jgi:hypothetical protein
MVCRCPVVAEAPAAFRADVGNATSARTPRALSPILNIGGGICFGSVNSSVVEYIVRLSTGEANQIPVNE